MSVGFVGRWWWWWCKLSSDHAPDVWRCSLGIKMSYLCLDMLWHPLMWGRVLYHIDIGDIGPYNTFCWLKTKFCSIIPSYRTPRICNWSPCWGCSRTTCRPTRHFSFWCLIPDLLFQRELKATKKMSQFRKVFFLKTTTFCQTIICNWTQLYSAIHPPLPLWWLPLRKQVI